MNEGFQSCVGEPNPATIMTDPGGYRVYVEPLSLPFRENYRQRKAGWDYSHSGRPDGIEFGSELASAGVLEKYKVSLGKCGPKLSKQLRTESYFVIF